MSFFENFYYKWRINCKLCYFNFIPFIDILEEYNRFDVVGAEDTIIPFKLSFEQGSNNVECFKNSDNTEFDIYYRNLHLHYTNTEKNKMFTISLKKPEDDWVMSEEEQVDMSHPINEVMEIFYSYDTLIADRKRCCGVEYIEGTWDKYFYVTLTNLEKTITGLTIAAQFSKEYACK